MDRIPTRRVLIYLLLTAAVALAVVHIDVVLAALGALLSVVLPLFVGFAMAYVLNLIMTAFERLYAPRSPKRWVQRSRRPACIVLSYVALALVLALIARLVMPRVIDAVTLLVDSIQPLIARATDWLRENYPTLSERASISIDWQSLADRAISTLSNGIGGLLGSSVNMIGALVSGVFSTFVAIAFSAYLLASKDTVLAQMRRLRDAYLPPRASARLSRVLGVANEAFRSFIVGQCTEAAILGALCCLGMWVFGFPYATTVGVFVGATSLIPVFGAYLGAAVGALLILSVDPLRAVLFLLFIVVLQQLEGNLIYPRVVGTSIGLPGIWVFVAVVIGGGLGGVLGMLLGVPLAATLYKLARGNVRARLGEEEGESQ